MCRSEWRWCTAEAAAIFQHAGVNLLWTDPTVGRFNITVNVVPEPFTVRMVASDVLGATPGHAGIAYVFHNPIQRFARRHDMSVGVVMGHAIAHELGHATLHSSRHGLSGLMTSRWNPRQALLATEGLLHFTDEESRAIRTSVALWARWQK